jgi:hypothetical protein
MNVDWDEAPQGAEAGHPGGEGLFPAWFRKDTAGLVEQICPAAGINTWTWMGGRKDFPVGSVLRPPILMAHYGQLSASSAGFDLITCHEGLISSIKNFASTGKNIEAFGYLFGVIDFHHRLGFSGRARLRQVSVPSSPAWNGEGLPPAGTHCIFTPIGASLGFKVEIIAHFDAGEKMVAVYVPLTGARKAKQAIAECFKPIKSDDQIAAEQRLNKAIELYGAVMDHSGTSFKSLPAARQEHYLSLIDKGWQKVDRA